MAAISHVTRRTLRTLGAALLLALFTGLALADTQEFVKVKRVIDGDTIMLESGERVRLIGVDTPETVHPKKPVEKFGKEASAFTKRTAEWKRVRLEYDQANAVRGHKDNTRQRRTLAYVFLEDGTLLNAEIIRQGYGYALTRFPFSRLEEFRRLEREARDRRRGLWAINPKGETMGNADKAPVTIQELLVSSLAQSDVLAKLLIEKGIITQQEFLQKISQERATYQNLLNPVAH